MSILKKLMYSFTFIFPPSSHPTFECFFPVGISFLIQHFQQVLWVLEGQEAEVTSKPTRPVENVVLTVNCSSQETEVKLTPTRPLDNVVIATNAYRTKTQI